MNRHIPSAALLCIACASPLTATPAATRTTTAAQAAAQVVTRVVMPSGDATIERISTVRVASDEDDAEEESGGRVRLRSGDLDLSDDGAVSLTGLRFPGLDVPHGARITSAHVVFEADESEDSAARLNIVAEASDDATVFLDTDFELSRRSRTAERVAWSVSAWRRGDAGPAQRSPNLAAVVQEVVSRPGWRSGNALALFVDGSGRRSAESHDARPAGAATLDVAYRHDGTPRGAIGPAGSPAVAGPAASAAAGSTRPPAATVRGGPEGTGVAPVVTILSPVTGASVDSGAVLAFEARALDVEHGDVGASLVWRSNRDGEIGSGNGFDTDALTAGAHEITARAVDLEGFAAESAIEVTVVETRARESDHERIERIIAAVPADRRRFVDGAGGADEGDGTRADPWRTLGRAFERLRVGDTLFVRAGTYDEAELLIDERGDEGAWTTIRNYPTERVRIDGSLPEFRVPGGWESVDERLGLWRSRRADFGDDVYTGKMRVPDGRRLTLVPYWSDPGRAAGLQDLVSTEYEVSRGPRYVGPGVHNDGGRLHVRLRPVPASAMHGRDVGIDVGDDPNAVELNLTARAAVLELTGSFVRVEGLEVAGATTGIELEEGASNVEIRDVRFDIAGGAVRLRDGVRSVLIEGSTIDGGFPPWVAWTDMKGSRDGQSRPASYWAFKSSGGGGKFVTDVTVRGNRFVNVFDAMVLAGRNIAFVDNRADVVDDLVQLGSDSSRVEIAGNRVLGPGPSHNGRGDSAEPGTTWIHHNVIDARREILWGKRDPRGRLRDAYRGWRGNRPFPDHSSRELGLGDPWKIYHNTLLFDGSVSSKGAGIQLWDERNRTGVSHEVYNNVLVETGGGPFVREMDIDAGPQVLDGNVYWRSGPGGDEFFEDVDGPGGERDHASLDEFRGSRHFDATARDHGTGWESGGTAADPGLDGRHAPSPTGSAASGAVPLPDALPGPRHVWRGALPPR